MTEFKLSKHQVIARELFGESKETYEMERADLYQRLVRLCFENITGELSDEQLARSYKVAYKAQLTDAVAGHDEFLDAFLSTYRSIQES